MSDDPSWRLLRDLPSFRWYWVGQSLSFVGSQVSLVALPLLAALTLGAGPAGVSAVATAGMLPHMLFSLLLGHWLEGRDQRRVMVPADLLRAALLALIPVAWLMDWLSIQLLVVVAFLAGVAGIFFEIAGFALVPSMVNQDDLSAANRAIQGSSTVSQVSGPGLAGLLVQALSPALAVVVDAVSYLTSALGVAASRSPRPAAEDNGTNEQDSHPSYGERNGMTQGLRLLFHNRYLGALTVHAAVYNLASQVVTINLVLWLVRERQVSPGGYGLALSAGGVGAVVGTFTALMLADRLRFGRAFAVSLLIFCGVPLLLAAFPTSGSALAVGVGAVLLVSGIGLGNANVYSITLRQTAIPSTQLARSVGAYRQIMYGSIPIGAALAGVLGEIAGIRTALAVGTVGLALLAVPMLARSIRTLQSPEAAVSAS